MKDFISKANIFRIEYVKACIKHLANVKEAGAFALDYLTKKGYTQRLEYVKKVTNAF